ncbi:MAG: hypothetical protein ACT4QF_10770 [Sporichthyaceae bacterium]
MSSKTKDVDLSPQERVRALLKAGKLKKKCCKSKKLCKKCPVRALKKFKAEAR